MTNIVERLRRDLMEISYDDIEAMAVEAAAEIERLRTRLAIQFGMHPGGDLAKATSAEIERLRMELAAAIGTTRQLAAEIERLRAGQTEEWLSALREVGILR